MHNKQSNTVGFYKICTQNSALFDQKRTFPDYVFDDFTQLRNFLKNVGVGLLTGGYFINTRGKSFVHSSYDRETKSPVTRIHYNKHFQLLILNRK